MIDPTIQI
uniref:Uncharacterized protein n=1 Tax=Arundo donax TaxID=35708 RepID=A0A0A8Y712_ARUDO